MYALFANPWAGADLAYHSLRLVLAMMLTWLTFVAIRRFSGLLVALTCGLFLSINLALTFIVTIYIASALIVVVALLIVDNTPKGAGLALSIVVLGILVRPEFIIVALCSGVALHRIIKQQKIWFFPAVFILVLVTLYPSFSSTFDGDLRKMPGGRVYLVFGQHYAWTANDLGYWEGNNWFEFRKVLEQDFGNASTLYGFFKANPRAFLRHIIHNIRIIPIQFSKTLKVSHRVPGALIPVMCLMLITIACLRLYFHRHLLAIIQYNLPQLYISISAVGMFLPWIIIRTRYEYMFALVPIFMLVSALAMTITFPQLYYKRTVKDAS